MSLRNYFKPRKEKIKEALQIASPEASLAIAEEETMSKEVSAIPNSSSKNKG